MNSTEGMDNLVNAQPAQNTEDEVEQLKHDVAALRRDVDRLHHDFMLHLDNDQNSRTPAHEHCVGKGVSMFQDIVTSPEDDGQAIHSDENTLCGVTFKLSYVRKGLAGHFYFRIVNVAQLMMRSFRKEIVITLLHPSGGRKRKTVKKYVSDDHIFIEEHLINIGDVNKYFSGIPQSEFGVAVQIRDLAALDDDCEDMGLMDKVRGLMKLKM